ncbi:hypothetical protein PFLUV_G00026530 [Perca fluviatilis]|uniref:Uncharacterized protein n=1 Tax=Perca fluviatilis TaxID=8168 RepID=A0A6A5EX08_PERFL|nr:hypothetical protein PFLUV_G00026530 [Perca fluviatilis]
MACKPVTFFAMDVACKYWPYLRRVTEKCPELQQLLTMKPFLSVFHAKAHDFKCEVKWSGAYQEGAGSTLGEEVEQCNAFLSRIAVTTKHMSKAATTSPNDADVAAVASQIEELVASVKRRSQRLYKDHDGCKGRARIRRKIREEKQNLNSVVDKYNTLVPNAEKLTLDTILSDEIVWPWQLTHGDLRTKRKAFDTVMAVRRLEEEKRILIAEMNKHWKSLCTRADTLKQMSSQLSNVTSGETWGLLQDGIQGLQSLTMKNK